MTTFTAALKSWVSATFPTKANNLSDLASAATARTNLGLGDAATKATGTTAGTVAAGDDPRITGAQSAAGLDAAVAAGIINSASATNSALSSTYETHANAAATYASGWGAERMVSADDVSVPALVIAAAGDSTIDMPDEWLTRGLQLWCADRGRALTEYHSYGDAGPYQTTSPIPEWTDYYRDEFTRAGDVYGSTPDTGVAYTGSAGGFTCDGARAVSTGTNAWVYQTAGSAAPGGRRRVALDIDIDTTGAATDKILTLYIGTDINNGVVIELKITASTGAQVWSLGKKVAGVQMWLATGVGSPLAVGAASATISVEINASGLVTGTIGASTVTGQLSAAETAAIVPGGYMTWFRTYGTSAAGAIALRRAYAQTGTANGLITLYNGSKAATTLTYPLDKLAALYPAASIDLLVVSNSHNYNAGTVDDYLTSLDTFVKAYRTLHPESGILLTSQNPEYSPIVSANILAHRDRNAAIRKYAKRMGYGYLPIAEKWGEQASITNWIQSDGVHPTRATEVADPANATYTIAGLLRDHLAGLSAKTKTVLTTDPRIASNLLTVGEETFSRHLCNGSATGTNSTMRLTFFTARTTETVNSVRITTGGTAAGATPTLIRVGVYSVDAAGNLTLVGSTASDTTLFAAGSTAYTKAFSAAWVKTAGQRYAVGVLVVTGAAAPTLVGNTLAGGVEMGIAPRLSGAVNGQTDLPATVAVGSVSNTPQAIYSALIP